MNPFIPYINEEYRQYGDAFRAKIIDYYKSLSSEKRALFVTYIEQHHNHAFDEIPEWDEQLEAMEIARKITPIALEVLTQCVEKPKFDGDVVSKNGKQECYKLGLLIRICNNGEFGDNAANHMGWLVHKEVKRLQEKIEGMADAS